MVEVTAQSDEEILREVQDRFTAARDFEAQWRKHALEDLRFFHADAYNHAQWDDAVFQARNGTFGGSPRPCLTINKTAQHVFQVENDARQRQMGIKVNATGFGASEKAADVIEGIVRHIEYQSNAQQNAYACAIQGQTRQGIGWVHILTDYVRGQDSFDQDFFIKAVPDPRAVYSDPNTQEPDHSDMQWAMLCDEMPREEFERLYPGHKDIGTAAPLAIADENDHRTDDVEKDIVRVFRYYRRNEERDTLWAVPDPKIGAITPMRESNMAPEAVDLCRAIKAQSRPITRPHVEFFLIAGSQIIAQGPTVFRHIPLVPFIGIESVIDGRLDRCGLVRALIDPQRMFNYSASAFVESVAIQTKSPWLVDERSIEGYENQWAAANVSNQAYLPYRSIDPDDSTALQAPQRLDPPTGSTGHMQAMQNADLQMQMVTGQYQAEMGAPGNERSGRAINERQRQSDTANYHYTDNQGMALRLIGRILIDAIPLVYDTARAVQVMGEDGTQTSAIVDPAARSGAQVMLPQGQQPPQGATIEQQLAVQGAILAINPTIGRYDVEADVGPAYATRRQETWDALSQILQAAPEIAPKVLPFLFKASDFPLADQIYDALTAGPDAATQQLQGLVQHLQGQVQQLTQQLHDKQQDFGLRADKQRHEQVIDLMDAQSDRDRADTDRMAAIGSIAPDELRPVLADLVRQVLREQGYHGAASQPAAAPAELERLPSTNPPGGQIHAPNPVNGAVDV
ncbi:hypothetical protein AA12717_0264 [Gluconacetobacter sacchari DSM 12717]|uniref:Portal protein n=2 Tax=Gluconacetobacter sacchari TaxID=92759 RepID=A0A7W4IAQ3_9PROT|nr:portal protein [Gluconacetobacter sacchari]MBB2159350.1 hypothetical protein [Gluconacetobacter sacchari]GBQ19484.1 hypothetical protein AA12717_0264 [Gluconacetobacter sacchari DSM 12717]